MRTLIRGHCDLASVFEYLRGSFEGLQSLQRLEALVLRGPSLWGSLGGGDALQGFPADVCCNPEHENGVEHSSRGQSTKTRMERMRQR